MINPSDWIDAELAASVPDNNEPFRWATAMLHAAHAGDVDVFRHLLSRGAEDPAGRMHLGALAHLAVAVGAFACDTDGLAGQLPRVIDAVLTGEDPAS